MNVDQLTKLLEDVKNHECEVNTALELLKTLPYEDLSYAKVDHHRELRNGYPEVIYSPGKSLNQIKGIVENMLTRSTGNILASRAERDVFDTIKSITPDAIYYEEARSVVVKREEYKTTEDYILVVTAGTSDIPVAEEAAVTAMVMGNQVKRLYDVGVAGIHRLLGNVPIINHAKVIIVVAGMEGALASVVGGLTDKPIVAVPTSIGYGASFGGISALLGMLTSCASGIGVVNIDNGFGAACMASKINKL
ncbi:nickel pincer cofactor biosynthesis protein LarB [Acetobacterium wieringae]|uniref:AIR carboxylase n=1 Tax=Acetobacterium wieringae TaxID=52694 RepID=A0A1F2PGH0_9FIRM|nr:MULTISPECIES: nickel pincer cofactor biosynthesis protein LarB [Acetobacterium]MEA4804475.1 nickel pincer cofactor biosynthesis protein LarB [Acetobacterium wieringae]OFV69796.1 AIR carboxylase [Acetobacterium wieringae]TYC88235.1 nickel pincer cofactor biosynthesis protein LarB [Acetobacterium wieringae]URN83157.1 nickel pincer cofactor biosynthesis protein LarB [Acetobacterium wieringae]UYO61517.1 nickel pincer cofactor biosynthesis protein LarB [Acetobacterium wieringae]